MRVQVQGSLTRAFTRAESFTDLHRQQEDIALAAGSPGHTGPAAHTAARTAAHTAGIVGSPLALHLPWHAVSTT